jgi:hypothetical protein
LTLVGRAGEFGEMVGGGSDGEREVDARLGASLGAGTLRIGRLRVRLRQRVVLRAVRVRAGSMQMNPVGIDRSHITTRLSYGARFPLAMHERHPSLGNRL